MLETMAFVLTMEDVVAREDGVPALSDVLLLLELRASDAEVDMNLKLRTLYHLLETLLGSKSARLTCAQPCNRNPKNYNFLLSWEKCASVEKLHKLQAPAIFFIRK